ncbi:MAG: hypothetical protein PHO10_04880 [Gemmiger sp.]|nr:hypothetical protein [Gemmiger sp.]
MKKIVSMFLSIILAFTVTSVGLAEIPQPNQSIQSQVTYQEALPGDILVITTITTYTPLARTGTDGSISKKYTYGGKEIGWAYLSATFDYNGTVAYATSAGGDITGENGWSGSGKSTWCSGNTAYLTGTLSGNNSVGVNLSLSCSPGGNLY